MSVDIHLIKAPTVEMIRGDKNLKIIERDDEKVDSIVWTNEDGQEFEIGSFENLRELDSRPSLCKPLKGTEGVLYYLYKTYGTMFYDDYHTDEQELYYIFQLENITKEDKEKYFDYAVIKNMLEIFADDNLQAMADSNEAKYNEVINILNENINRL